MSNNEIKGYILRVYDLMEEITDRKAEIKERNQELDELYDKIANHLENSGNNILQTEDGEFELKKSIKFSKRKGSKKVEIV